MNGAIKGLQGWVDCFNKASLKGVVRGLGADALGSIAGNPALEEALPNGVKPLKCLGKKETAMKNLSLFSPAATRHLLSAIRL